MLRGILPTFDTTITVLNKLKSMDSVTKQDIWYKTVIHNCAWKSNSESGISGTSVVIGGLFVVRIPEQPNYIPYSQWKENPDGNLTFSVGDIIIKGEIEEDIITTNNISKIFQKYQPDAFYAKVFQDNTRLQLASHYRIDGSA